MNNFLGDLNKFASEQEAAKVQIQYLTQQLKIRSDQLAVANRQVQEYAKINDKIVAQMQQDQRRSSEEVERDVQRKENQRLRQEISDHQVYAETLQNEILIRDRRLSELIEKLAKTTKEMVIAQTALHQLVKKQSTQSHHEAVENQSVSINSSMIESQLLMAPPNISRPLIYQQMEHIEQPVEQLNPQPRANSVEYQRGPPPEKPLEAAPSQKQIEKQISTKQIVEKQNKVNTPQNDPHRSPATSAKVLMDLSPTKPSVQHTTDVSGSKLVQNHVEEVQEVLISSKPNVDLNGINADFVDIDLAVTKVEVETASPNDGQKVVHFDLDQAPNSTRPRSALQMRDQEINDDQNDAYVYPTTEGAPITGRFSSSPPNAFRNEADVLISTQDTDNKQIQDANQSARYDSQFVNFSVDASKQSAKVLETVAEKPSATIEFILDESVKKDDKPLFQQFNEINLDEFEVGEAQPETKVSGYQGTGFSPDKKKRQDDFEF